MLIKNNNIIKITHIKLVIKKMIRMSFSMIYKLPSDLITETVSEEYRLTIYLNQQKNNLKIKKLVYFLISYLKTTKFQLMKIEKVNIGDHILHIPQVSLWYLQLQVIQCVVVILIIPFLTEQITHYYLTNSTKQNPCTVVLKKRLQTKKAPNSEAFLVQSNNLLEYLNSLFRSY